MASEEGQGVARVEALCLCTAGIFGRNSHKADI